MRVYYPKYSCWDCGKEQEGASSEDNTSMVFCDYCSAPYDMKDWPQMIEPRAVSLTVATSLLHGDGGSSTLSLPTSLEKG